MKLLPSLIKTPLFSLAFKSSFVVICFTLFQVPNTLGEQYPVPKFEPQLIGKLEKGYGLSTGDVDGDGKRDILLADRWSFVWFRNGDWKRFVFADRLDNQGAMSIDARDIDGDGKVEIAICTRAPRACIYFLERPKDPTQIWKPIPLESEPNQHRLRWAKDHLGNQHIISVPIHAKIKGDPVSIYAYEFPSKGSTEFKRKLLINTMSDMHNFSVIDGKKNEAERLFFIGFEGIDLMGNSTAKRWQPNGCKRLPGMTTGLGEVDLGATVSKEYLSIAEPKHGTRVVVYPADNTGKFGSKRIVLDETLVSCHALECEDVLSMGRDQVIAGWWGEKEKKNFGIRMYIPLNDDATKWKTVSIDQGVMSCQSLQIADMDNDGKLDLIAAGWTSENLIVYWNRTKKTLQKIEPNEKK